MIDYSDDFSFEASSSNGSALDRYCGYSKGQTSSFRNWEEEPEELDDEAREDAICQRAERRLNHGKPFAGQFEKLTDAEETQLFGALAKGALSAFNAIMQRHLPLLGYWAKQFRSEEHSYEDLINVGYETLEDAISNYRLDGKAHFNTYATRCIIRRLDKYTAQNHTIRLSEDAAKLKKEMDKHISLFQSQYETNSLPTVEELAEKLEAPLRTVASLMAQRYKVDSLDRELGDGEEDSYTLADTLKSDDSTDSTLLRKEFYRELDRDLNRFSDRDKQLVFSLYGLNGQKEMEPAELALETGVTTTSTRSAARLRTCSASIPSCCAT